MRVEALANSLERTPPTRAWGVITLSTEPVASLTRVSATSETEEQRGALRILSQSCAQEVASLALSALHTTEGRGQTLTPQHWPLVAERSLITFTASRYARSLIIPRIQEHPAVPLYGSQGSRF